MTVQVNRYIDNPADSDAVALLQSTIDSVDAGIAVIGDAGSFLVANPRFFTMLDRAGLLARDLAGSPAQTLAGLPLDQVAPGLSDRPDEVRGPGGRVFSMSYKMDPPGLHGLLIQMRDITGQVIDAGAVDEARARAEMIEQTRNAFVSQVAHHFRTPLHVILGYVDILADTEGAQPDPVTRNSYLQFIRESAAALLLNMNEMMEIIRLQRGDQAVELESRDLGQLLETVIAEVRPELEAEEAYLNADDAVATLHGHPALIDVRLARRGLNSLLRTCAVLGGQGCEIDLDACVDDGGAAHATLRFRTGRATASDVIASIEAQEPVKEISLTGRASGYGIVLAVLLLKECNAQIAAHTNGDAEVIVTIDFASEPSI